MLKSKTIVLFLIFILFFSFIHIKSISAEEAPYRNYTYDFWGEPVRGPQAYLPTNVWNGSDLGVGEFDSPEEIFVNKEEIFILDSGNNRIICLDKDFNVEEIIDEFYNKENGDTETFSNPSGIFVKEKKIFLADTENSRIIIINRNSREGQIFGTPESNVDNLFSDDYNFSPESILVDKANRIYVIGQNEYRGLLVFSNEGNFQGFIGAPNVNPNPTDYLWSQVATQEQRQRMQMFLPIEYNQFALDEQGFILGVSSADNYEQRVRKLNPAGEDRIQNNSFHPIIGDIDFPTEDDEEDSENITGPSQLIDILSRENGRYSILDGNRNRVFTYDKQGELLYVFGGPGNQKGIFSDPVAIEKIGKKEKILVLDQDRGEITEFTPTKYTQTIHAALDYYNQGLYNKATEKWQEIINQNLNYEPAYNGIGLAHMRSENWEKSLDYFKLGNDRENYSIAFTEYRRDILVEYFSLIIYLFLVLLLILIILYRYKNKLIKKNIKKYNLDLENLTIQINDSFLCKIKKTILSLKYSLNVLFHPLGGFWDLKHEKKGNLPASLVMIIAVCMTFLFMRFNIGFIFNYARLSEVNIWVEIASVLVPFILWCIVNWALTTLMDGKGSLREIVIATSFALIPLIIINIPMTVISNFLTEQEGSFYYLIINLATVWTLILIFIATMSIHDYTLTKAILTIIGILVGMGMVFFLILLFIDQIEMLIGFVSSIYRELFYRV
ncbi:MAG: YIP1 family protein [Nanoarchaeota archaeon]